MYAAKQCLEAGWRPTVFEESGSLGGVWRSGNHWDTLTTNSSYLMMSTSDFPFPFTPSKMFPRRDEIVRYVQAYAAHFDILPCIQFNTSVLHLAPLTPGDPHTGWSVQTSRGGQLAGVWTEQPSSSQFDLVLCCSGQYSTPAIPAPIREAIPRWQGHVQHSHGFESGSVARGERVLVVGLGNSALDVALECLDHGAASVLVCARRGAHLLPVASSSGKPKDVTLLNRWTQYVLPTLARNLMFFGPTKPVTAAFEQAGMPPPGTNGTHGTHQRISNLKRTEDWMHTLQQQDGRLRLHPSGLASLEEGSKRVTFFDGAVEEVDRVVLCTGYELGFPYLAKGLLERTMVSWSTPAQPGTPAQPAGAPGTNVRSVCLFNRVMHPEYPTLNVLAQLSTLGNEAAVGEMQARWITSMLGTDRGTKYHTAQMKTECLAAADKLRTQKPLFPAFVSYLKYMDKLAEDIGCTPPDLMSPAIWWQQPTMAWQLLRGPAVPAQWRLNGPDSKPDTAKQYLQYCQSLL